MFLQTKVLYKRTLTYTHFCLHLHCARLRHFLISCSFGSLSHTFRLRYTSPHSSSFYVFYCWQIMLVMKSRCSRLDVLWQLLVNTVHSLLCSKFHGNLLTSLTFPKSLPLIPNLCLSFLWKPGNFEQDSYSRLWNKHRAMLINFWKFLKKIKIKMTVLPRLM